MDYRKKGLVAMTTYRKPRLMISRSGTSTGATCPNTPVNAGRSRVSSPWGWRDRPGGPRFHYGIDIGGPGIYGEPVVAVMPGVVEHATANGARGFSGYGHVVVIRHNDTTGLRTFYSHLKNLNIAPGMQVRQGQKIGEVGNTNGRHGNPTTMGRGGAGAHLHFEVTRRAYPKEYGSGNLDPMEWYGIWGIGRRGTRWIIPEDYCRPRVARAETEIPPWERGAPWEQSEIPERVAYHKPPSGSGGAIALGFGLLIGLGFVTIGKGKRR